MKIVSKLGAIMMAFGISAAHAVPENKNEVMISENDAGGYIVLTLVKGDCKSGSRRAVTGNADLTAKVNGCWSVAGKDQVLIVYSNGKARLYGFDDFKYLAKDDQGVWK